MKPPKTTAVLPVTLLLLTTALAGCADLPGMGGDGGPMYGSFEDAQNDVAFSNTSASGTYTIGMITPDKEPPAKIESQGDQKLVFVLWDTDTGEPVTGAENFDALMDENCGEQNRDRRGLCAFMPGMGHGTSDEVPPTHDAHGVYTGKTTWSMPGYWVLNFNPTIDGETVHFDVPVCVQSCEKRAGG